MVNDVRKEYDFSKARRGPIRTPASGKTRITIRLDGDVLAWFKAEVHAAGGGNYQSRINDALREHIGRQTETLEGILRRVVREELAKSRLAGRKAAASGVQRGTRRVTEHTAQDWK